MLHVEMLLMEPQEGGNLGSICRALKTLGFPPPKLIAAPEGIERSPEARRLAHGAREYLQKVERYDSMEKIAESYDFLVGTTARRRRTVSEYVNVRDVSPLLRRKGNSLRRVGILFGSEASGLPSAALKSCDLVSTVPLETSYPSLNLAQAVLLYAYELSPLLSMGEEEGKEEIGGFPEANRLALERESPVYKVLAGRVTRILSKKGVNAPLVGRIRERLAHIEEGDLVLIHSILNAIEE